MSTRRRHEATIFLFILLISSLAGSGALRTNFLANCDSDLIVFPEEEPVWKEGHYFPWFPSTEQVYAIHVRSAMEEWWGDRSSSRSSWRINQSHDTMTALTLVGIQGVVNRKKPAIYLDWDAGGNQFDSSQFWLTQLREHIDVIDLHYEGLEAIEFLLEQYGSLFRGVVVYDPDVPDTINLATMLAGLESRLILAPEQLSIPLFSSYADVYDLRALVDEQGWDATEDGKYLLYEWVYENLWPRLEQRIIGLVSPGPPTSRIVSQGIKFDHYFPMGIASRDYIVALNLTALWLSPIDEPQASLFAKFLEDSPNPTPIYGFFAGDEVGTVELASKYGDWVPVITNGNSPLSCGSLTVLSGVRPEIEPYVAEIDTDSIFSTLSKKPVITLGGSDGDSVTVCMDVGYRVELRVWDYLGGWDDHLYSRSINPTLIDLAPLIWNYYIRDQRVECDFVCGFSGAGYIFPQFMDESQLQAYLEYTARYMDESGLRTLYYNDRFGSWGGEASIAYSDVLRDSLLGVQVGGIGGRWELGFFYSGSPIPAVSMPYLVLSDGSNQAWIIEDLMSRKPGEIFIELSSPWNASGSYPSYPWHRGQVIDDEDAYDGRTVYYSKEDLADLVDIVQGPFADLEPGKYTVVYSLKADEIESEGPFIILWAGGYSPETGIFQTFMNTAVSTSDFDYPGEYQNFTLSFELDSLHRDVEFGILSDRGAFPSENQAPANLYADYIHVERDGGSEFPVLAFIGFSAWFEGRAVSLAEEFLEAGGIVLQPDEFMAAFNPKWMLEWATEILGGENPGLAQARKLLKADNYYGSLVATRRALLELPNQTYQVEIPEEGEFYTVTIRGDTWIEPLEYLSDDYTVWFDTHGPPDGTASVSIAIPNELQNGETNIVLDGSPYLASSSRNESHTKYNLEFNQGPHAVEISLPLNKPPNAAFTYTPTDPTVLDAVQFLDDSSDPEGAIALYEWDLGDGSTSMEDNPIHSYDEKGTYTVTLTVTDDLGLTDTVSETLTVRNSPPTADFSISPSSPRVGEMIQFSDQSADPDGDPLEYHWDFGDGASSILSSPQHMYSSSGSKWVLFTVFDNEGAGSVAAKSIMVEALRPAEFEVSDLEVVPNSVFVGEEVTVTVICTNVGEEPGEHMVTLCIDGVLVDDTEVSLGPGESSSVDFAFTGEGLGAHTVEVDGESGSFTVARKGIPGFPLGSIALSLALALKVLILRRLRDE